MDRLAESVLDSGMTTEIRPGQTLENPVTGERFTFVHTAATTGGELLAFDLARRAGGAVPVPHVHPIQTERFEVVAGTMRFRVGLRTVLAGPGDVVEVAPGVVHGFANAGDHEARVRVEVRPALAMEDMLAEVVDMAKAGRMTRRGLPRNPFDLALLARKYDREAHAPLVSVGVQRALLAPLVWSRKRRPAAQAGASYSRIATSSRRSSRISSRNRAAYSKRRSSAAASISSSSSTIVFSISDSDMSSAFARRRSLRRRPFGVFPSACRNSAMSLMPLTIVSAVMPCSSL